ncbi:amidase domain-containing protein [Bifidobacterium samirii]|uniref:Putative amidase domain-containing protein n=1 Tax=Bifidobacterium samirii TaxID=2306974 RepID=A0A430FV65_9BIFI|nr:amidase domain-containing protein [Bifidobacterium samirii]RSX57283.1 putative amidase domain-containing protein [Bifidobacterium samirii]
MRKRLLRIASVICLISPVMVSSLPASAQNIAPDYQKYLATYVRLTNEEYSMTLSESSSLDEETPTREVPQASQLIADFIDSGIHVLNAEATAEYISDTDLENNNISVTASINTTVIWSLSANPYESYEAANQITSVFSDLHKITFDVNPFTRQSNDITIAQDLIIDPESGNILDDGHTAYSMTNVLNDIPRYSTYEQASTSFITDKTNNTDPTSKTSKLTMNYSTFVHYLNTWTSKPYDGDEKEDFNPDFPYFTNNCTNFGSQALYAAGLPLVGGSWLDRQNPEIWTWNLSGMIPIDGYDSSWSWSNADSNYQHLSKYTPYSQKYNDMYMPPQAGLIYAEWDADPQLDHLMLVNDTIVIQNSDGSYSPMPLISQKTPNRNMVPFSVQQRRAEKQHDHVTWKGLGPDYTKMEYV